MRDRPGLRRKRTMLRKGWHRGFSLAEILAMTSVLAALLVVVLPMVVQSGERDREDEVRSNIHVIQVALERYAVDSGGFYPYILYGGDETDTFAKWGAPINPETGVSHYQPPLEPTYDPFPGDFDVLIQFGYLAEYPRNPFQGSNNPTGTGRILTNPAENGFGPLEFHFNMHGQSRTNIWALPFDRSLHYVRRLVGGKEGNLMWDVSEGQRHAPWPVVLVPEPEPHWTGYINPAYSDYDNLNSEDYSQSHQFWLAPGNFYYYGVFEGIAGYSSFVVSGSSDPAAYLTGWVIGYRLCGYGGPTNLGDDVYNLWGDFEDRSLFTANEPLSGVPDLEAIYVGHDGRPDGVIIMVESGTEMAEE